MILFTKGMRNCYMYVISINFLCNLEQKSACSKNHAAIYKYHPKRMNAL
jgi:hypothetical protein